MRGTPQQIVEKYQSLARDKATAGDRVLAEAFLQHAEHYLRILSAAQPAQAARNEERQSEERPPAEERPEEERSEEFAVSPGEPGADGMAVIGEDDPSSPSIVETPENSGGGRRRGRRPGRRPVRSEDEETGAPRRAMNGGAAEEGGQAPVSEERSDPDIVVDGNIRAAE